MERRLRVNDQNYFEYLIDTYQNLIFSICYQQTKLYFEAEDLTQETFLSAYKALKSFDRDHEKAWLSRIALNKCLDYHKQAARRIEATEIEELQLLLPPVHGVEVEVREKQVQEELRYACEQLKNPYKEVALGYYYKEMTLEELAKNLQRNKKTIQTQIYRARGMLKKWYKKELSL